MSAFRPWTGPNPKPSRTASTKARREAARDVTRHERAEKSAVRRRDRVCRFPLCACGKWHMRTEVSHLTHKGTHGRETKKAVSVAPAMILLCFHRHQDGPVSIHHGTLDVRPLTDAGTDGPVAWFVDAEILARVLAEPAMTHARREAPAVTSGWVELAREESRHRLAPIGLWQRDLLLRLGDLDW